MEKNHYSNLWVVLAVAVILAATLVPTRTSGTEVTGFCLFCGRRGGADFLLNIALYAPLGMALGGRRFALPYAAGIGGFLSLAVELAQVTAVPGRDASPGDLVANVLGVTAGWLLVRNWHRVSLLRSTPAAVLTAVVSLVILLTGLGLLEPSFPDGEYLLRWTPRVPLMEPYQGQVLASRVGQVVLLTPDQQLRKVEGAREELAAQADVEVLLLAGPPPSQPAPVLEIVDGREREIAMLGIDHTDLFYRFRLKASHLRMDRAETRFPGILEDAKVGEILRIVMNPGPARSCAIIGSLTECVPGFTVGETWTLLAYRPNWNPLSRRLMNLAWLTALFLPSGIMGRRRRDAMLAALVVVAGLIVGPLLLSSAMTPVSEFLAGLTGVAIGAQLR